MRYIILLFVFLSPLCTPDPDDKWSSYPIKFAVIGDYGANTPEEAAVAELVDSWNVDFIITLGDNNYPDGGYTKIDTNIGQYYHEYIYPYYGSFGSASKENRFWPSLGGHDLQTDNGAPYLNYFELPDNERNYSFTRGNVQFISIENFPGFRTFYSGADPRWDIEWIKSIIDSTKIVIIYTHTPPFSSGHHGDYEPAQHNYKSWGVDMYLAGHEHSYERIERDITYVNSGCGGAALRNFSGEPKEGSVVRSKVHGALVATIWARKIDFKFYSISGELIDRFKMRVE